MNMTVEIKCEKPRMKVVYTYSEVEEIQVIGDRLVIKQKDDIPNVSTFSSEWEIHIKDNR